jgi:murein DD-endopeptidase MepM/ murein hydrolase activator NlpD
MDALEVGQKLTAGDQIAAVGRPPENGNWPPHLHLQLILDLLDLDADFPGVATTSQQELWCALSPSPACFFQEFDPTELRYK